MITVRDLMVYHAPCRRRNSMRAYTGKIWHVATPDGKIVLSSLTYPTTEELEYVAFAVNTCAA